MDFSEYTGPSEEWLALEATLPPPPLGLPIEELKAVNNARREQDAAEAMNKLGLHQIVNLQDHTIPTRDGNIIEARSYRPTGVDRNQPLPVYLHFHGGGFVFGTLSSEDATCAQIVATLAEQSTFVVVVNVNYRHTPEHKYPVAWNDAEDAFFWVHDHVGEIGGDSERLVIGGISAGAWLTASLTLEQQLREPGDLAARPRIKGQVLMIPVLVHHDCYEPQLMRLRDPNTSSWVTNRDAPILPRRTMEFYTSLLGIGASREIKGNLRLNPGNATAEQVTGLPPTTFGVAGLDPLRDEGLLYADLLSRNGVPTQTNVFRGVPHGFRRYGEKLSVCEHWDRIMVEGIKFALSDPTPGKFEIHAF